MEFDSKDRAKYQRLRRKQITLQSNGKTLQCRASDLLQCNKILLLCNVEEPKTLLQSNGAVLQFNTRVLQNEVINKPDNSRIFSDFDSKNSVNSNVSRAMGGKGWLI
jgi:hypothetical protein